MKPSLDRRDFLRTVGGLALASTVGAPHSVASLRHLIVPQSRKPRVLVLAEDGFPAADALSVTRAELEKAFQGWEAQFQNVSGLEGALSAGSVDLLVTPYGSAFPETAWNAILGFLGSGGSWVNLGGTPLANPVVRENSGWRVALRKPNSHKRIGITQSFPLKTAGVVRYVGNDLVEGSAALLAECKVSTVHALYVRFTTTVDFPSESGTSGPRDALLRPVIQGLSAAGRPIAAPVVLIDRMQGEFAGGRWVFAAFEGSISSKGIRLLCELALEDSHELTVTTPFACYYGGEQPLVQLRLRKPRGSVESFVAGPVSLTVRDESGTQVSKFKVTLQGTGTIATGASESALRTERALKPGLYTIDAALPVEAPGVEGTLLARNGFWIYDRALITSGRRLTAGKDFLMRDGKPFPVAGTTYMASDVHRKFLFEPNPALWDADFRAMRDAGITMVRTGIWTGWRSFVLDSGRVNEVALRALDAFLLTAHRYDIPVIFTFFAFVPELWGGANPYLDQRAVDAQKEFLAVVAQRYSQVDDLVWDLINEPSFDSPSRLWSCRPNYDAHEAQAWSAWLGERHAANAGGDVASAVRERWNATPDDSLGVPSLQEFADVNIFEERRPLKAHDFRLFAQDMFTRWVRAMSSALRSNGNTHQLITVGQDEAGTGDSPNPHFFADAVDFTCLHNWWANADLLWDSLMTKVPGKANLVEETGVMFYETMDSSPWRSESEVRDLLERKIALSFGANGAGFIQWIWNTNSYMTLDNEVAIGFHRADGTAKPELEPALRFARFFREHREWLVGKSSDDVVMVIPHSQMFSVRNLATLATKQCVRIMHHACRVPLSTVSEHGLGSLERKPALVLVPSARVLTDRCWEDLLALARSGSTVAITGYVESDEYWRHRPRLSSLGLEQSVSSVAREERLRIEAVDYDVSFRGDKLQRVQKAVVKAGEAASVATVRVGSGALVWSPLALELSESDEAVRVFYEQALNVAGVAPLFTLSPDDQSILVRPSVFERAILYCVVSESGNDGAWDLTDIGSGTRHRVALSAGRADMILLERSSGKLIGRLEPAAL